MSEQTLRSHNVSSEKLDKVFNRITARIKAEGDKPHVSIERQLELLTQLSQFDFGRFLLQNQGLDGYWTHYILTYPWFGQKTGKNNRDEVFSDLEIFLLKLAPTFLATQQRFILFLREIQKKVQNNAVLACIPCGMMGELLYLDFKDIDSIRLVGIDYDLHTFEDAKTLAKKKGLLSFIESMHKDAWDLSLSNEFDLISSNGLNIYEVNDDKVFQLYQQFYEALKPGGQLVTSFLTLPPSLTDECEWLMEEINSEDLMLSRIIFSDIINAKWQCFRSTRQTKEMLSAIGYINIKFIYDKAHMFPTVVAIK